MQALEALKVDEAAKQRRQQSSTKEPLPKEAISSNVVAGIMGASLNCGSQPLGVARPYYQDDEELAKKLQNDIAQEMLQEAERKQEQESVSVRGRKRRRRKKENTEDEKITLRRSFLPFSWSLFPCLGK